MSSGIVLSKGFLLALVCFLGAGTAKSQSVADVAMATLVQGAVSQVTAQGALPLQSFVKLKQGDVLALPRDARLRVVYFESGRQETWQGGGRLEITRAEGQPQGLPSPEIRTLPVAIVKQISRTPAMDTQGRTGMIRLRSVATAEDIARLEDTYKRLRMEADRGDLNPEIYLLSSMFEIRQLDRVEQILGDLQKTRGGDPEAGLLVTLYQKALKNAREAKAK